jgi:hypothetical protein
LTALLPILKVAQLQGDESWKHAARCQLDHVLKQNDQTDTIRHLQWLLQYFHQINNSPDCAEYIPVKVAVENTDAVEHIYIPTPKIRYKDEMKHMVYTGTVHEIE